MNELVEHFRSLGCENVRTYIQSGNVVFEHPRRLGPEDADAIGRAIAEARGFAPHILLLGANEFRGAVARNPFPTDSGKALHFFFLASKPEQPDLGSLEILKAESEAYRLDPHVFYLYAPDGIGRSKLAARVSAALGVSATARNWNTVAKLASLLGSG